MKKIYCLAVALLSLFLASCSQDDGPVVKASPKVRISIVGDVPATAYPGDDLEFVFSMKYAKGISEAYALVDGTELEGSRTTYPDAPDSTGLKFTYRAQDAYAGNTIDFAVVATATDGAMGHYDIPVFILAAKPAITVTLPADAPESFEVTGEALKFNISIVSSNIDMKSVTTYKGDAVVPSMSFNVVGDARNVTLPFNYTPTLGDTGTPTVFTFEILDVNGNIFNSMYSVTFFKAASDELNEYSGITMGLNKCVSYGQFINFVDNVVYMAKGVGDVCDKVDMALFWSGNSTTIGVAFASPNATNVTSIYPEATIVSTLGGTEDDIPTNWSVRNETNFRELEMDADAFAGVSTAAEVEALFAGGVAPTNDHVTFKKVAGSVVAFKINRTESPKYGLIRVTARPATNNTGTITIDYKIEK